MWPASLQPQHEKRGANFVWKIATRPNFVLFSRCDPHTIFERLYSCGALSTLFPLFSSCYNSHLYICIYTHMYVCKYIYICIYIYIYKYRIPLASGTMRKIAENPLHNMQCENRERTASTFQPTSAFIMLTFATKWTMSIELHMKSTNL